MALYRHRFEGATTGGDPFSFGWWSDSSASLSAAQSAVVTWLSDLYAGSAGTNGYATLTAAGTAVSRVSTAEVDPATGQQLTLADDIVTVGGTSVATNLPPEIAIVVSLRTLTANRSGRGRFYLPQPTVDASTADGNIAPAQTALIADAASFAWTGSNATLSPVVYSRIQFVFRAITAFNVGDRFDSIRHRDNSAAESRSTRAMP